ncbi:MAG: Lrp/AsnC family transcriptional regulator [Halomonas sp.]|jgi:Lrp/AsnC family leucine-responsive transcriptional regulator|uniref:Lrp/AsnC family transcriptional regulator n=1 Tax=Billgrantia tianxiuensis TaxID=2497861 RepID=A0A6I6SMG8_9GAMM|nr:MULTISPECIES: Lrp/AsnC family transcriptional regulator [Halomonas]MCE8033318.1 Lrp/AsnC family transcriptional regulator [Halomonas sp. MCCC 1A11057]MDX5432198.1 Lrp/AsnC family transcriptional regulator [Halomonas sp.]QHC49050.1 Lrp/AsnC family transcriptional regulator [Halomonas tianxiuensis]
MPNSEKTEVIRGKAQEARPLDAFDRKILGELAQDAGLSYAELGSRVGLSAPAVHERVKRLRATGRIRGTVAMLDGPEMGKPFLAFVHVDSTGWGKTKELLAISELPEVEEIHSVAGDACMLLKVRCASSRSLEGLLARLYALPCVKATRSYVVLSTFLERTPQAGITEALEETMNPLDTATE